MFTGLDYTVFFSTKSQGNIWIWIFFKSDSVIFWENEIWINPQLSLSESIFI